MTLEEFKDIHQSESPISRWRVAATLYALPFPRRW